MFSLLPLILSLAQAAPPAAQVLTALTSPSGWSTASTSSGVAVSQKTVPGLSVPAFRGVRTVPVDCARYWVRVSNPDLQKQVNDMLEASRIVTRNGDKIVFTQRVDLPLISDRYWINIATNEKNIGGVAGHFRQSWSPLDKANYPAIVAEMEGEHGAVFTPLNYGFWDLKPAGPGQCTVTYAAVSDPGGSIPGGAGSWASEKSLPDNINLFFEAAR
jgi:hypothetical protein